METLDMLIKSLGITLLQSLWQSVVLYTVLLLIIKSNPNIKASTRHTLAVLAMSGIVIWTLVTFSTEFFTLSHSAPSQSIVVSKLPNQHSLFGLSNRVIKGLEKNISWVVLVYVAGLIIQSVRLIINFYNVKKLRFEGVNVMPSSLRAQFLKIINKTGINKKISLNISEKVFVPMVLGHIKPVILLPVSAVTNLNAEQIEAILMHELAHICRNDYLINLITVFVETILFFNPFVLMIGKMMEIERENACDDFVLKHISDPVIYIETLFHVQEIKHNHQQFILAVTGKNHQLLNRIKRIANGETKELPAKNLLYLPLMLGVFLLIAWMPAKFMKDRPASSSPAIITAKPIANLKLTPKLSPKIITGVPKSGVKRRIKKEKISESIAGVALLSADSAHVIDIPVSDNSPPITPPSSQESPVRVLNIPINRAN
jgi:bla regulator protein BlaR1